MTQRVEGLDSRIVRPYPPAGSNQEAAELDEVLDWTARAHDQEWFDKTYRGRLSGFLQEARYVMPFPAGAVLNGREDRLPIIRYGAELATLFEDETPGLWHRHVLNFILDDPADPAQPSGPRLRDALSPPRQALIWHALDNAIDSALAAVWHFKWIARGHEGVARRRRPREATATLIVYDYEVERDANGDVLRDRTPKTRPPVPSPGTPRHPAYGSGHSTYSAAASYVLACLLPARYREDFMKLAENIGEARIFGGVHWRTDHDFGRDIGQAVGRSVIDQLNRSGISPRPSMLECPPSRTQLDEDGEAYRRNCGSAANDFCAQPADADLLNNLQGIQG